MEFLQISKNIVDVVCLELMMQDPQGHGEKEQAKEEAQAMENFCLHEWPAPYLTSGISETEIITQIHDVEDPGLDGLKRVRDSLDFAFFHIILVIHGKFF